MTRPDDRRLRVRIDRINLVAPERRVQSRQLGLDRRVHLLQLFVLLR
jgi:hypothetical protein